MNYARCELHFNLNVITVLGRSQRFTIRFTRNTIIGWHIHICVGVSAPKCHEPYSRVHATDTTYQNHVIFFSLFFLCTCVTYTTLISIKMYGLINIYKPSESVVSTHFRQMQSQYGIIIITDV